MVLRTLLLLLLIASPAAAHVFPYTFGGAYGPNGVPDATPRACTAESGCFARGGGLCADRPGETCDLQVVPAGRCAEGEPALGNLWPAKAGRCHDDPRVACLADAPNERQTALSCGDARTSCLFESRMCADVPDATPDLQASGLCDMSGNDNTAWCSRVPGSFDFETEVCGGGPGAARCSDGDPLGAAGLGLGEARCSEIASTGSGSSYGSCGPAAGRSFPEAGRTALENPPGAGALLLRKPGSVGASSAGEIREPRTTAALGIETGPDAFGVRRFHVYGRSFWADPDERFEPIDGILQHQSEATQPCVIPPGWEPGLPVSGRCSDPSGAATAVDCFKDEHCAAAGGTCSIALHFCREPGAVIDGFGALWTRDLLPAEQGACPPDCGSELDQTSFEREELARIGALDPSTGIQAVLESLEGERAGAGDAIAVRPWSTPVLVGTPSDPRCFIGGDPDPVANPLGWLGRCTHDALSCDPASGDADPRVLGVQTCGAFSAGSDCHACAQDPFYATSLPELGLAGRVSWIQSGSLPGTRIAVSYVLPGPLIDTNTTQSLEFRDPLAGEGDRNGLGPVEGGGPGIALESGRTQFHAGEPLPFRAGARAAVDIAIRPPDPGLPLGPLLRPSRFGPGPDGVPGCFGSTDPRFNGAFACRDPLLGNTGSDDVAGSVVIAGGPALGGVPAAGPVRSASPSAVAYFGAAQGPFYGYAAPDPPTFETRSLAAARDLTPLPGLPDGLDRLDRVERAWCPLVGGGALCTPRCVEGGPADYDCDGIPDASDVCPYYASRGQADLDRNGRGDACECGDADGDGRVAVGDLVAINRALFEPERRTVLCDANGDGRCDVDDIVAVNRDLFSAASDSTCSRHPFTGVQP